MVYFHAGQETRYFFNYISPVNVYFLKKTYKYDTHTNIKLAHVKELFSS